MVAKEKKLDFLRSYDIRVVICTVRSRADADLEGIPWLEYYVMPVPDGKTVPLDRYLPVVNRVIQGLRAQKSVLVHCAAGRNRSGLVVALALRQLLRLSGEEAYWRIKAARPTALANSVFEKFVRGLPRSIERTSI